MMIYVLWTWIEGYGEMDTQFMLASQKEPEFFYWTFSKLLTSSCLSGNADKHLFNRHYVKFTLGCILHLQHNFMHWEFEIQCKRIFKSSTWLNVEGRKTFANDTRSIAFGLKLKHKERWTLHVHIITFDLPYALLLSFSVYQTIKICIQISFKILV
jgi:hypothetical protein